MIEPRRIALALLVALGSGCAHVPSDMAGSPDDPWEGVNRKIFAFNEKVDEAVLRPAASAYVDAVPLLVRQGTSNLLGNIGDVWSSANHLLQGKLQPGLDMGMRVLANTLFGLGGVLDPATEMGLVRRSEDFGQTLARWGLGAGPYVVLPLLGPSTLRDAPASWVDWQSAPSRLGRTNAATYIITAIDVIDLRAGLLGASQLLDDAALDRYTFVRQTHLAQRLDAVHDGSPPMDTFDDEPAALAPDRPALLPAPSPPPRPTPAGR